MCVICVLGLIVVPLPPGKYPFAVKLNNNNNNFYVCLTFLLCIRSRKFIRNISNVLLDYTASYAVCMFYVFRAHNILLVLCTSACYSYHSNRTCAVQQIPCSIFETRKEDKVIKKFLQKSSWNSSRLTSQENPDLENVSTYYFDFSGKERRTFNDVTDGHTARVSSRHLEERRQTCVRSILVHTTMHFKRPEDKT
jgi:hypothetical protein